MEKYMKWDFGRLYEFLSFPSSFFTQPPVFYLNTLVTSELQCLQKYLDTYPPDFNSYGPCLGPS